VCNHHIILYERSDIIVEKNYSTMPLSKQETEQLFENERKRSGDLLSLRKPTKTGEAFKYVMKALAEVRSFTPKTGPNEGVRQEVLDVLNLDAGEKGDPYVEVNKEYTLNLPKVLKEKLKAFAPLTSKIFALVNLGKPSGKKYYAFSLSQQGVVQ
jgi:hypothetical protein